MASPRLSLSDPPSTKSNESNPPARDVVVSFTRSGLKRTSQCWSELPQDLLRLIFERLGFADFQRAKTVCSPWHMASRKSQANNQIPWMFLFPKDKNYGLLFNPEEKDKVYKTQDFGNDFGKSFCVATYRSWLLMITATEGPYIPYILDLLTRERINLPTFTSDYGLISPVLWIDEKTKDYLVLGMVDEERVVSVKKGDNSWKQVPQLPLSYIYECFDMIYKDHKLYCINYEKLTIFDFSRQIPSKVFKISVPGFNKRGLGGGIRLPGTIPCKLQLTRYKKNMVITVGGDILIVNSTRQSMSKIWNFTICKMGSSKGNKWEEIVSLGDEAILLDLGITVLAKDIEGIKRNSIYFNGCDSEDEYDEDFIFIFDLDTKKVEKPHQFVCSSVPCSNARWFLPSFKRE